MLVKIGGTGTQHSALAQAAHAAVGGKVKKDFAFIGWQLVTLPTNLSVSQAIALYKKQPGVLTAEPNYIQKALVTPNDSRYPELWGMEKIQAPTAWNTTTGSSSVVVGVIDTGVRYTHEDLAANMWRNPGESGGGKETNGVDDDGNGYTDDVFGIDAANGDSDPMDDNDHGSHCSGTIGGVGNNGKGVAGVNWNVKIMALKFLASDGGGSTSGAITCFQYATMMKQRGINIRVLSNSWGGGGFEPVA